MMLDLIYIQKLKVLTGLCDLMNPEKVNKEKMYSMAFKYVINLNIYKFKSGVSTVHRMQSSCNVEIANFFQIRTNQLLWHCYSYSLI